MRACRGRRSGRRHSKRTVIACMHDGREERSGSIQQSAIHAHSSSLACINNSPPLPLTWLCASKPTAKGSTIGRASHFTLPTPASHFHTSTLPHLAPCLKAHRLLNRQGVDVGAQHDHRPPAADGGHDTGRGQAGPE